MKPSDFFSALLSFFNDFVGMAAPGFILLFGLFVVETPIVNVWQQLPADLDGTAWLVVVVLSYTVGHILLSLYLFVSTLIRIIAGGDSASASEAQVAFARLVGEKLKHGGEDGQDLGTSELRSLAMSVSQEAAEIARRFMFISLFCNGVGVSLSLIMLVSFTQNDSDTGGIWISRTLLLIVAALLFWRGHQFEKRARYVPFPIALSSIIFDTKHQETDT